MIKGNFPLEKFKELATPFYYYDMKVLRDTIAVLKNQADKHHFTVHYAIKANFNAIILKEIKLADFGACTYAQLDRRFVISIVVKISLLFLSLYCSV